MSRKAYPYNHNVSDKIVDTWGDISRDKLAALEHEHYYNRTFYTCNNCGEEYTEHELANHYIIDKNEDRMIMLMSVGQCPECFTIELE